MKTHAPIVGSMVGIAVGLRDGVLVCDSTDVNIHMQSSDIVADRVFPHVVPLARIFQFIEYLPMIEHPAGYRRLHISRHHHTPQT